MDGQTTMNLTAFERLARSRQRAEQLAQVCRGIQADTRQLGRRPMTVTTADLFRQPTDSLEATLSRRAGDR